MSRVQNIISKLRFSLKKPSSGEPITVYSIWTAELLLSVILAASFLLFDLWIYRNFVESHAYLAEGTISESRILLNRGNLDYFKNKFFAHESFLDNPSFPFVPDPF